MEIVLIYDRIYVIIKGRVIECPSISNMEGTAVIFHLREREEHITKDRIVEDFTLLLVDVMTNRIGTPVGTSHLT